MTEITGNSINVTPFKPFEFIVALLLSPVTTALLGTIVLLPFGLIAFVPIGALVMGVVPYLAFGGPVLLLVLRKRALSPLEGALVLLAVNTWVFGGALAANAAFSGVFDQSAALMKLQFGAFFAPVWGAVFAAYYNSMT